MATWGGYDGTIIATRFQKTFIKDYLDLSGRLDVRNYDVSLNNRLFVMNDASFMGNVYINGNLTANIFVANSDVSLNNRLFVLNDASFMSNVYVDDILTVNLNLISNGDASLNSNVFVAKDISCNGNISIGRNLTINGNLAVQNYTSQNIINTTTTNYQFVVSEDLSLNGRLAVSNDVSMNGNLFVFGDISLNGNLRYNGSFLKNISVDQVNTGIGKSVYDTIFGYQALSAVPTGSTGYNNTAIGYESLLKVQAGTANTGFGHRSLYKVVQRTCHTAVGLEALFNNTTSDSNTAIGYRAGLTNTTGGFNTYIGTQADAAGNNFSNSTAIGYLSSITRSNEIVLGTSSEIFIISRIERHLAPPIIIRKATTAQTFSGGAILFPTSVYDNGFTGLGYNNATGVFTNNNSYSITLNISVSVNLPANAAGLRALYITTGPNSYDRYSIAFGRGINNTYSQHLTTLLPLGSGGWFSVDLWQNTGSNLTITTDTTFTYPTIITIHVF